MRDVYDKELFFFLLYDNIPENWNPTDFPILKKYVSVNNPAIWNSSDFPILTRVIDYIPAN